MEYICDIGVSNDGVIVRRSHVREKIVRCKDCEYAYELEDGNFDCNGKLVETWDYYNDCPKENVVPANGFCFCGKRREVLKD